MTGVEKLKQIKFLILKMSLLFNGLLNMLSFSVPHLVQSKGCLESQKSKNGQ